jgi:hypothetical protein
MAMDESRELKLRKIAEAVDRMRRREEAFSRDGDRRLAAIVNAPAGGAGIGRGCLG